MATIAPTAGVAPFASASSDRVASVDLLRGAIVALMIFVNDLADVAGVPGWLQHAGADVDAMTVPDFVLPAFLFIAGLSVPIALERARAAGATTGQLVRRIFARTLALVAAGILLGGVDEHLPDHGAWGVLAYLAALLAFVATPLEPGSRRRAWRLARTVGWLGMLVLALCYRTPPTDADPVPHHLILGPLLDATDPYWLYPSYWGILGMIGWGYFASALAYLVFGRRREWLIGITALLLISYVSADAGYGARLEARTWLHGVQPVFAFLGQVLGWIDAQVPIREVLISSAAITVAGCSLGGVLATRSRMTRPATRTRWAAGYMLGLLIAAVLFDAPYGLSKEGATPAWGLLSAAIATGGWIVADHAPRWSSGWQRLVAPAGANPLLAYLLHPFLCLLAAYFAVPLRFYQDARWPLAVHLGGSLLMTFGVVQAAGFLGRSGFRLKA